MKFTPRFATTLAFALSAVLAQSAVAQQGNDSSASKDGQTTCKVKGVVAGVTVVGETMVDYQTNRAAVAQVTYLSVIGKPADSGKSGGENQDKNKSKNNDSDKNADNGKEKSGSESSQDKSGEKSNPRPNLYVLAIPTNCEVCESCDGEKTSCDMTKLELGDKVEVEFATMAGKDKKPAETKHGKSRTYMGQARSITILTSQDKEQDSQSSDSKKASSKHDSDKDKKDHDKK